MMEQRRLSKRNITAPIMKQEVRKFFQSCVHFIISRTGERIPKLSASSIHGKMPNKVVCADFLYTIECNKSDVTYLMLIKDDLTSYTWLYPCENADSAAVTYVISKWIFCFGGMDWLVTSQGLISFQC